MKALLDYGTAIERLRERKGLSREDLARVSGVSYSYLSKVERGLKRPSTDVLVKLATALEMLPSDFLRYIEEVSAKGRGLFRKRVLEAPMHEHAGDPPEVPAMLDATIASPGDRVGGLQRPSVGRPTAGAPELDELVRIASTLDPEDLRVLLDLAGRLSRSTRE